MRGFLERVVTSSSNVTTSSIEKPETSIIYSMLGIFLCCNICGLLLTTFCLPARPHNGIQKPESSQDKALLPATSPSSSSLLTKEMMQCFKMVLDTRMLLLMPLFAAQAMAVGVLYSDYTKAYISCSLGVKWVGYVMASYGMCTAVFAFTINNYASALGRVFLFSVAVIVDTGSLVAMVIWEPDGKENVAFYFLIPAVSGISEGIMQAQFYVLVSQVFASNITPAFAAYHTSKAASFTVTFALTNFVCLRERLYLAIALYIVGLLGYLITELRLHRSRSSNLSLHEMPSEETKKIEP